MRDYTSLEFWKRGGPALFESELATRAASAVLDEVVELTGYLLGQGALPGLRELLAEVEAGAADVLAAVDAAQQERDRLAAESEAVEARLSVEVIRARADKGPWPREVVQADREVRNAEFRLRQAKAAARDVEVRRHRLRTAIERQEARVRPELASLLAVVEALG